MSRKLLRSLPLILAAGLIFPSAFASRAALDAPLRVAVRFGAELSMESLDGRLLLLISKDESKEPRFLISDTSLNSQQVFGIDVDAMKPGEAKVFDSGVLGYPLESLSELSAGTYSVQALLHRYETFRRADGHTVKLPMDRGEGQQWARAPGNLYSTPRKITLDPRSGEAIRIDLDKVIPPIPDAPETKYIKHERIQSALLTKFWGRPMYLGAHILLPEGFDTHPNARYPLMINHGHFPYTIEDIRETPPDPNLKCEYSERFHLDCYNRIVQQAAYDLYKEWTGPKFPRVLVIEIQHANPYYDDSYAVNSENLGPYGDAIVKELIPYIEKKYRGIGQGWARFMYGGSTGGWEALAAAPLDKDSQLELTVEIARNAKVDSVRATVPIAKGSYTLERLTVAATDAGDRLFLNLYRLEPSGQFTAEEVATIEALAPLLAALAAKHVGMLGMLLRSRDRGDRIAALAARLHALDGRLTRRETDVLARVLLGVTSDGIALDLGVGLNTVLTYRKRAYARLGVTSQAELFSLCL